MKEYNDFKSKSDIDPNSVLKFRNYFEIAFYCPIYRNSYYILTDMLIQLFFIELVNVKNYDDILK